MAKRRLLLALRNHMLLVALVPLLAISVLFYVFYFRATVTQADNFTNWQAKNVAAEIKRLLDAEQMDLQRLAGFESVRRVVYQPGHALSAFRQLQSYQRNGALVSTLYVFDEKAELAEAYPVSSYGDVPTVFAGIFEHEIQRNGLDRNIRLYLLGEDTLEPQLVLVTSLIDSQSSFYTPERARGLLFAVIALPTLLNQVEKSDYLTGRRHNLLLQVDDRLIDSRRGLSGVVDISSGASEIMSVPDVHGELRKIAIEVQESRQDYREQLDVGAVIAIILAVVCLLYIYTSSKRIYQSILDPLRDIVSSSKAISAGDFKTTEREYEYVELQTINTTLNELRVTLEDQMQHLRSAREKAELSEKLKSEFLANMSHEIRTPINGVSGMLQLLGRSKLNADQKHKVTLARQSADALLVVINDILDFSKIESNKLELEHQCFDARALLEGTVEFFALAAQEKGLEILLDTTELQPLVMCGDRTRVRQVINNLLGNAIKFTEHGHILVRASAEEKGEGMQLRCSVNDTGIGISDEARRHLFEAFSQADASTTRKYGGTGLGLSISQRLCELMGGGIEVRSELGKGSEFEACFLLDKAEEGTFSPEVRLPSKRVCVMGTASPCLDLLRRQLVTLGLDVIAHEALGQPIPDADWHIASVSFWRECNVPPSSFCKRVALCPLQDADDSLREASSGFDEVLTLPVTHAALVSLLQGKASADSPATEAQCTDLQHCHLLVAEDNAVNREVVAGMLEDLGCRMTFAVNGREALARCERTRFDAILMDCQMPELDGFGATERIRQMERERGASAQVIIALTANAMESDRERCLAAGMDDYLSKPVDADALETTLMRWLCRSEPSVSLHDAPSKESDQQTLVIWDEEAVLKRMRGKPERVQRMARTFLASAPALQQRLASTNDTSAMRELAHEIKGAAANLSLMALQAAALALEADTQSATHNDASTGTLSASVLAELDRAIARLESECDMPTGS